MGACQGPRGCEEQGPSRNPRLVVHLQSLVVATREAGVKRRRSNQYSDRKESLRGQKAFLDNG